MTSLGSEIIDIDQSAFAMINKNMSNSFFDQVMPVVTDLHKQPLFWVVLASFILYKVLWNSGMPTRAPNELAAKSRAVKWSKGVLVLALSMGLSDLVTYRAVKIWVQRDRPEAAGLAPILRTESHSGWSFPSNHAANNFALARTVQIFAPPYALFAYAFAAVVAFSRVYVGVHFPGDALTGALIGLLCASLVGWIFRRIRSGGYFSRERTTGPSS